MSDEMNYIQAQRFAFRHECAECGNSPSLYPNKGGGYEVRCQNRNHKGFIRLKGYYQAWREGQAIPIEIAQNLIKKERRGNANKGS